MKIHVRALSRHALRDRSALRGFTLLEVLVSIVVLSFGVLGVVGLQAAALQANKEARYQSTAVALGRELGDLMRGNKDLAITTGGGNPYLGDFNAASLGSLANPACTPCASTTEVAQFNIRDWVTRLNAVLPGFRVKVCFDATPYSTTDNLPQWACTDSGGVAVVKIGWTRTTPDSAASAAPVRASDAGSHPVVILPLIAGSSS
jgi:type IV pilus assembly protein PilV